MFKKILIANRGEIALRILRACKELNIKTVAIHSEADESAIHVKMADESICVGPASAQLSYLNIPAIVTAATLTNADAIHPGYGFLSESKRFAEIIEEHKIKFIGPTSKHIGIMGDKIKARRIMRDNGVPIVPGLHDVNDINQVNKFIDEIGLPIIIKAASGGGGKGMRIVKKNNELKNALGSAKIEAKKSFNNDILYIEKFISTPKHIEIQILADAHGNVLTLGERDCSIQRKHQKLIEECPSLCLEENERQEISELCRKAMMSIGYEGVGTLEFLYDNKKFYFMEMNTRLQVEHPITEMVTQIDLVKEQIFAALGEKITKKQDDILLKGHAIECRINAEHPETFIPSPGNIKQYYQPGGLGIRVDSSIYQGCSVPPYYDSLIAKLITYADNREDCIKKMKRALEEYIIVGVDTNIQLHQKIIQSDEFITGNYYINYMSRFD
ncbi:MAG: acetyl-CoA carboxylase biotin carboxylase subunit [Pelagibacteraceae bacterium]|jgi:acetyl-CoA carboxylase biotin carboxylase subunit|nr:acetyl-CoA carboxylase biotin carboxylase subunit [Pelagibacteraceae bacterium]HJO13653.1 acetyl-CoA carboxylase biotin carboxylase subunit [Alphaproteobacteria bacterium]MBO6465950.1 acetyl-CoA carboxylase biotin carboxylase subunit [Pelagibacteraceae bacterium]MBO6468329.1 acetyl-CoA carboxylase biotin carboxylase subunit [Pelagibacteraceae bacterium]MBO6470355.1 acetyl-CoA carboxylase biotin carboxylase subunit [Pelagibacteraceae bacterium]